MSPSLPSPRTRVGNGSTGGSFDGVLNGSDNPWNSGRSRGVSGHSFSGRLKESDASKDAVDLEIKEEEESSESNVDNSEARPSDSETQQSSSDSSVHREDTIGINNGMEKLSIDPNLGEQDNNAQITFNHGQNGIPWDVTQFAAIQWSYVDPTGNIQGMYFIYVLESVLSLYRSLQRRNNAVLARSTLFHGRLNDEADNHRHRLHASRGNQTPSTRRTCLSLSLGRRSSSSRPPSNRSPGSEHHDA